MNYWMKTRNIIPKHSSNVSLPSDHPLVHRLHSINQSKALKKKKEKQRTMSVAAQQPLTNSLSHLCFYSTNTHDNPLKTPTFALPISLKHGLINPLHFVILPHRGSSQLKLESSRWRLRVFEADETLQRENRLINEFDLDSFLSVAEMLCLASSAVLSIGCAVNWTFLNSQKSLVNRVLVWQFVLLVGGVGIGALIRTRQWRRISRGSIRSGGSNFNLLERIEKLEEELRSSATIIRGLSRQLEKLGIRFRVTRKTLKEPIAETAALAQKNSEATRALAVQEDNLEKEVGEIQKILLAMQEQQQKQLELILAIGKIGKAKESKQESTKEQETSKPYNVVVEEGVKKQMESQIQTG